MPRRPLPPRARFWQHVRKSEGCWEWTGYTLNGGYGRVPVARGPHIYAHRLSWEIHNGPIPPGLWVLHHCDNPRCVRPDHLFLGTNTDNVRDAKAKGRNARGEKHGMAKLTDKDVINIRRRRAAGATCAALAAEFGVWPTAISRIARGLRRGAL